MLPIFAIAVLVSVAGLPGSALAVAPGARLWVGRFEGPGGNDIANALVVSPDGSAVFVTGTSTGGEGDDDYLTVAHDASTGMELWATRYDGPALDHDIANALAVSPDGSTVFVTGKSWGSEGNTDYATVAYHTSTGAEVWAARYDGPSASWDDAYAVRVSTDGSVVFVTGRSVGSTSGADYTTVAYHTSTGAELWAARYDGPANRKDRAYALGVSPDGSAVFVTGESRGSTSRWDYATVAYDPSTGAELWATRYDGPANRGDRASALGVSPDGSAVFVTGESGRRQAYPDFATVAYDAATGSELWATRYEGPRYSYDHAQALGVSPDGSAVFVTGFRYRAGDTDYATVAYDAATGSGLWARRYDGPADRVDEARALGVDPGGSAVFVTGRSSGASGNSYATLAYAA